MEKTREEKEARLKEYCLSHRGCNGCALIGKECCILCHWDEFSDDAVDLIYELAFEAKRKNITRLMTVYIEETSERAEESGIDKDEYSRMIAKLIEDRLPRSMTVRVAKVQDFVRDIEDTGDCET